MSTNYKKVAGYIFFSLVLSIACTTFFENLLLTNTFLGALYTVLGVIFSVEMSMLYSLNPGRIRNVKYYQRIRNSILIVRDTSFILFSLVSVCFVVSIFADFDCVFSFMDYNIRFSFICFAIFLSTIVTIYLAWNFVELQNLNYQIDDKLRDAKSDR